MSKILLIAILLGVLIYFISRRFLMSNKSTAVQRSTKQGFVLIESSGPILQRIIKNTIYTVAIGAILFVITIVLAMKVKIILFALPISLYLMSQFFLLNNQLKYAKDQRIWFNPNTNDVQVEWLSGNRMGFNLLRDVQHVRAVRSVQKNRQVLFGYYELTVQQQPIYIPFIIEDNQVNAGFFRTLKENYPVDPKSSLFPII